MAEKYITLSKDDRFDFKVDRDWLYYEPVSITTEVGRMAKKIAEDVDTFFVDACLGVKVDPDALLNVMKKVRALEAEINRLQRYEPPCHIGDEVYKLRRYHSVAIAQKGIVSEMKYLPDMSLQIVVKHIGRGKWGEDVFATLEEAEKALAEREGAE